MCTTSHTDTYNIPERPSVAWSLSNMRSVRPSAWELQEEGDHKHALPDVSDHSCRYGSIFNRLEEAVKRFDVRNIRVGREAVVVTIDNGAWILRLRKKIMKQKVIVAMIWGALMLRMSMGRMDFWY